MNRTRRRPPYKPDGRTNFPARGRSGVYLIHDDDGRIVYVGFGRKDVYKALYRHFQQWNDGTGRERTTFDRDAHTVRMVYTPNWKQAERLERALILRHRPEGNPDKMEQHEFTDSLRALADAAMSSPFARTDEDAPF